LLPCPLLYPLPEAVLGTISSSLCCALFHSGEHTYSSFVFNHQARLVVGTIFLETPKEDKAVVLDWRLKELVTARIEVASSGYRLCGLQSSQ
jgi:hypothetical protein